MRGERTGIRYAIGTRVQVQVSRVDLDGRKIDFRLVREGEERPLKAPRERGLREPAERDVSGARRRDKKSGDKGDKAAVASAPKSPLQSLKAAVKKAVSFKKGRKSRR